MTLAGDESATVSPLALMESAREKYTLSRARREVPELALLSLHGAIEDTLRAHLLRIGSSAALGPFTGVLTTMQTLDQAPLSAEEVDAVQRLHRLRGRIARGEHLAVTGETLAAYQRLAVMLLPRYGVQVVPPVELDRPRPTRPLQAQTTLPGDEPVRVRLRDRHTQYDDAQRIRALGDRELADTRGASAPIVPGWIAPTLIIVSIFVIGMAVALFLQNPTPSVLPTVTVGALSPVPTGQAPGLAPGETPIAGQTPLPVMTPLSESSPTAVPTGLVVGGRAVVSSAIPALNVRVEPGINAAIQVALGPGTEVEIIAGPVERDGLTWWQVRSAGIEGWCAGELLQPLP